MARRVERIGLIGFGKHGQRYARHIAQDLPDLHLAAVARRDTAQFAAVRGAGAEPYDDYRIMLACAGLDAVVAVVPPTLHRDIVAAAAAAGVPLLLEKPAAPTLADGAAMRATLRAQPLPVMVAHTLRYNSVVRALCGALPRIGAVRSLTFTQRFEPSPLDWLDDPARSGGGMILHTGVHGFDLLRLLSGLEADTVTCQLGAVHTRRTEDHFVATVALGGGAALATVSCCRAVGGRNGTIEIAGEGGTLLADHVLGRATLVAGGQAEPLPVAAPAATVSDALRAFVDALRAGAPMPIPLDEGLRAVALVEACYAAAHSGGVVPVECGA